MSTIETDWKSLQEILKNSTAKLSGENIIAIDTEGIGGGSFGPLRRLWCITWAKVGGGGNIYTGTIRVDWVPGEETLESRAGRDELTNLLDGNTPVFHNAAHDVSVLREFGISLPYYHCSQVMGYAANSNIKEVKLRNGKMSKFSLEAWGIRLGSPKMIPPWESQGKKWMDVWLPGAEKYAEQDAKLALLTYFHNMQILNADQRALNHYLYIERPYIEYIIEMTRAGMWVDPDALDTMYDYCAAREQELLATARKLLPLAPGRRLSYVVPLPDERVSAEPQPYTVRYEGEQDGKHHYREWEPFDLTDAQVVWGLQHLYGWQPKEFSEKTGKATVKRSVLERLADEYPLVSAVLDYREVSKLLGTYLKPFDERQDEHGFVNCSWNQTITKTHRLSSSDPNLQNLPARTELGSEFRKVIAAPPGYIMVGCDLQAIEYRVLTALMSYAFEQVAGSIPIDVQRMIQVFNDPEGDIHMAMAELWLPQIFADDPKRARKISKNISYGDLYGFGIQKASVMMGISYMEAKRILTRARELAPSIAQFKQFVWDMFTNNGGIAHTFFGTRLNYEAMLLIENGGTQTLPSGEVVKAEDVNWRLAEARRQSFNAMIQGTSADVLKILGLFSLPLAWKHGGWAIGAIHDELLFYIPGDLSKDRGQAESFALQLEQVFNLPLLPHVSITGKPQLGSSWYAIK